MDYQHAWLAGKVSTNQILDRHRVSLVQAGKQPLAMVQLLRMTAPNCKYNNQIANRNMSIDSSFFVDMLY